MSPRARSVSKRKASASGVVEANASKRARSTGFASTSASHLSTPRSQVGSGASDSSKTVAKRALAFTNTETKGVTGADLMAAQPSSWLVSNFGTARTPIETKGSTVAAASRFALQRSPAQVAPKPKSPSLSTALQSKSVFGFLRSPVPTLIQPRSATADATSEAIAVAAAVAAVAAAIVEADVASDGVLTSGDEEEVEVAKEKGKEKMNSSTANFTIRRVSSGGTKPRCSAFHGHCKRKLQRHHLRLTERKLVDKGRLAGKFTIKSYCLQDDAKRASVACFPGAALASRGGSNPVRADDIQVLVNEPSDKERKLINRVLRKLRNKRD
jgi:hypothetical protein